MKYFRELITLKLLCWISLWDGTTKNFFFIRKINLAPILIQYLIVDIFSWHCKKIIHFIPMIIETIFPTFSKFRSTFHSFQPTFKFLLFLYFLHYIFFNGSFLVCYKHESHFHVYWIYLNSGIVTVPYSNNFYRNMWFF